MWIVVASIVVSVIVVAALDYRRALKDTGIGSSPRYKIRYPPVMRALRLPTRLLWHLLRWTVIAVVLQVLRRLFSCSQTEFLWWIQSKAKPVAVHAPLEDLSSKLECGDKQLAEHLRRTLWVCCHGKSGTNLVLFITALIAWKGDWRGLLGGCPPTLHIHDRVPWPDGMPGYAVPVTDEEHARSPLTGWKIIKTHAFLQQVPRGLRDSMLVTVIRDPKDVIVSMYHFFSSVLFGEAVPPLDFFVEYTLRGPPAFCWSQRIAADWPRRHEPNTTVLIFEELVSDPSRAVALLADRMCVTLSTEQLQSIVQCSDFRWMKQNVEQQFSDGAFSPLAGSGTLLRSGRCTGGRGQLSTQQRRRVDVELMKQLEELQCNFPYKLIYGCWDA